MRLWLLIGLLALLWAALIGWLWGLAADPGPRVLAAARSLGLAPENLQWLADALAEAGPGIQWVLIVLGAAGVALLAAVGLMAARGGD